MENIKTQNDLILNTFFRDIKLKKQYLNKLKIKIDLINNLKEKNYKNLNLVMFNNSHNNYKNLKKEDFLIVYVIDITFSRTNTLLHVMDFSGNLKYFCSAGSLQYKGKRAKKARYSVCRKIYKILINKLKFLKGQPLALHLKNVGDTKFKIIKSLKKKLFIKVVKSYDLYPHNGCRKKKVRRKKIRTKMKKLKP
jgi:ribosomal protein S11